MKGLNRIVASLLALGACGHAYASLEGYRAMPETLVWALAGSVLMLLIATLNVLCGERASDHALNALALVVNAAWGALAVAYGLAIGDVFDPRVLANLAFILALAAFRLTNLVPRTA